MSLLFGPTLLWALGFFMNYVCMMANGGQMPTLMPGGCPDDLSEAGLNLWVCMSHGTHLKFLADTIFIRSDMHIYSPGDFLMLASDAITWPTWIIWVVLMIRDRNA